MAVCPRREGRTERLIAVPPVLARSSSFVNGSLTEYDEPPDLGLAIAGRISWPIGKVRPKLKPTGNDVQLCRLSTIMSVIDWSNSISLRSR